MDGSKPQGLTSRTLWSNGRISESDDDITNLSLKDFAWRYRGEGNANLVLSLPYEKLILRMQKCDYGAILDPGTVQEWEVKLKKSVAFYRKIMVPLLGTEFILPPDLARISDDEISDIDRTLVKVRPSFRLAKGLRLGLVTVQPDYTLLPPRKSYKNHRAYGASQNEQRSEPSTFCVEIKPKQGWVPLKDRQHPKCTFCLKQYLKILKKRTNCHSRYCPLDLFSGDRSRMHRALEGLIETPQNNLKIFHNGDLLFGEGVDTELSDVFDLFFDNRDCSKVKSNIEKWCHLMLDALTKEFNGGNVSSPSDFFEEISDIMHDDDDGRTDSNFDATHLQQLIENSEKPCDWSSVPLPKTSILQRVLAVQKLQKSDFQSVYNLYKKQSELRENYSYVDELFSSNKSTLDDVQRYLLSATAKDCSIFIALQKTENGANEKSPYFLKDDDGVTYRLNIGISDIDPKPLSCIGKHHARDEEILSAVASSVSK
ncbi:Inositol-pentakisphosphate 2-kinase [Nesidiocoris tenuis]|uniref:Inositol-pentakisphosphate 2-kinase n=1 Tax=Nesidiocoris tenuis TaxID=355587 RepID=A0ABN7BDP2_9HEMI|nr:Inositol-pentakisphosphate 2-kinase [Nesidiocoris tenuis]